MRMTPGAPGTLPGSDGQPLRVAIIGSGPARFYSVERLFEEHDLALRVDMFDRLPIPFGLVRSGVAPDHPHVKSVVNYYHALARDPRFRFFGDIEFGTEVMLDDLCQRFHQIIFACGSGRGDGRAGGGASSRGREPGGNRTCPDPQSPHQSELESDAGRALSRPEPKDAHLPHGEARNLARAP